MNELKCPYCGWVYQAVSGQILVPPHDHPRYPIVCPGVAQYPRDKEDNRILWKDEIKDQQS